jgi:succinate dehydrogenase / fumarate reductase iron-sulfur subunit
MHPADEADRRNIAQDDFGLGYCNITKCCTEVCPEHIKITDNAIIPMKERVVDRRYDPLVWLGRKIFRRDQLELQTATASSAASSEAATPFSSARAPEAPHVGEDGKLDVAELLAQKAGGPSPFGDEQTFPLSNDRITYNHPAIGPDEDVPHGH